MKKRVYMGIGIFVLVLLIILAIVLLRGKEDTWIKDSHGVWIKHGVPNVLPIEVKNQQEAINCSIGLYNEFKSSGIEFNSQCLGSCGKYSVDIVHVPRNSEDEKPENQCAEFRSGVTSKFIEFDKDGNIVRVFDS